jgi:hypothetical protein
MQATTTRRVRLRRTRAYVAFDFDHDRALAKFIVEQARKPDSPFEIEDWSLKEAAPTRTWAVEAEKRISRCDILLIMVGPHTYRAPGVLIEVEIANRVGVPIRQVIGYRDSNPRAVPNAGRLYRWSWPTLKRLLTLPRRRAA